MGRGNDVTKTVDMVIGGRIHELRIASGYSRSQLAAEIGVTHQQLQKYEKAINRISAGRLHLIAEALNKSVSYFFEDIGNDDRKPVQQHRRMAIEVSRNFMKIKNMTNQAAINTLVRTLAISD